MIGAKLFFREWLRMMPVGVQSQQHRGAFLYDPHSCMTTSVNASLVSFGQTKPALQIQIVARQVRPTPTGKQSLLETRHQAAHLVADGILMFQ